MNWADLLAPRYHLACQPDGSLLQTGQGSWERVFLGFDRLSSRFVSIHTLPPRTVLPRPVSLSVGERVYLAGRASHPGLFNVIDYGERQDCLFYITELEEGEPLPVYLARLRSLPLPFAFDLAIQLVALLRFLDNFPRILGNVTAEDLLVSPSPGQSLCLRLAGLGLNREEQRLEPASLEKSWLSQTAGLLWELVGASVREDPQLKFSSQGSSVLLDPFRSFLHLAQAPSDGFASEAFRKLEKELHHHLNRFLEILDSRHRWPCPEECIFLRPRSLLARLLIDEGVLPQWRDHNYEFTPELFCPHSRFALAARDVRIGSDVTFQILPPHLLLGETGLDRLYRLMGYPSLKENSPHLRTFFLRSEVTCTFFAEESVHGFSLLNLLERRGKLGSDEAHQILAGVHQAFQELEPVPAPEEPVAPWNVYVSFASSVSAEDLSHCLDRWHVQDWPEYRLKMRLGPCMTDFTRPARSEWEEILHQLAAASRSLLSKVHHLDLGFSALAVFLLEYRRYRGLLIGGARCRTAVSCSRLHKLLASTLLSGQPHSPELRERFLQGMARQLDAFAYPFEAGRSTPSAPDQTNAFRSARPFLDPLVPGNADLAPLSARQHRVTLLNRLLRRESSRMRMKQKQVDQLPS